LTKDTAPGAAPTRRVFVAIPSYSGKLTPQTELALGLFEMEAAGLGWGLDPPFVWAGDSLIAHARNLCVGKFLQSSATDLIFLDADVGVGPGVFSRLMTHRVNFVAGVYRAKCETEQYMVRWLPSAKPLKGDKRTDLLEVEAVPFGLARLTRACIDDMVRAYPKESFTTHMAPGVKCWNLFNTEVRDGLFWGEDFYFCRKWRAIGGKVWVDWDIPTVHVNGDGTAYHGHLGNWIRNRK
jgi:hypothetical protein